MSRADPIEILERQAQTRTAALVPIRYGRMVRSPFAFFRGAALKEAEPSVLERFAGPRRAMHQGKRVVDGQQLMQAASDVFLGWLRVADDDGRRYDYYVRQPWDAKASIPIEAIGPEALADYGAICAWTLARAHARSGDRIAIDASLGRGDGFDRELARFAASYADQNERDHASPSEGVASGSRGLVSSQSRPRPCAAAGPRSSCSRRDE